MGFCTALCLMFSFCITFFCLFPHTVGPMEESQFIVKNSTFTANAVICPTTFFQQSFICQIVYVLWLEYDNNLFFFTRNSVTFPMILDRLYMGTSSKSDDHFRTYAIKIHTFHSASICTNNYFACVCVWLRQTWKNNFLFTTYDVLVDAWWYFSFVLCLVFTVVM